MSTQKLIANAQPILKTQVRQRFSSAANTYDEYCQLQTEVLNKLVESLGPHLKSSPPNRILDLGAGTGNALKQLGNRYPHASLIALDCANNLLMQAKLKYPKQHLVLADFDQLPFLDNTFDLIVANMALHWSSDLPGLLDRLYQQLMPQGILAISLPVAGTFQELTENHRLTFHSPDAFLSFARQFHMLEYHQQCYTQIFATHIEALRSIKRVGAHSTGKKPSCNGLRGQANIRHLFNANQSPQLSYQILSVILKKN